MRFTLSVALLFSAIRVLACDVCGCAMGNNFFGIVPNYQKNFVGLRYSYTSFHSIHPGDNAFGEDYLHTTDLWARFVPFKRMQLFAQLPYQQFKRVEEGDNFKYNGIGDISFLANYTLVNNSDSLYGKIKHFLQLGGGIKLPTGNNAIIKNKRTLPNPIQLGSGSIDYLANLAYTVRYNNTGLNVEGVYRINTENKNEYKNGNRFALSTKIFGRFLLKKIALLPAFGVRYDRYKENYSYGRAVEYTGGNNLSMGPSLNIFYKQWALSTDWQKPIKQNLNEGQTTAQPSFSTQLSFYF